MENIARVVSTEGERAVVALRRASACGENCAMCKGGCTPTEHRAVVDNPIGARVGDVVKLELPDGVVLRRAALVYGMPLLVLFAAYAAADVLTHNTAVSIAAAFAGLAAGFFILKAVDKRFRRQAVITGILNKQSKTSIGERL